MNNKLLLVIVLIASIQTVDWQGYGNMSSSNLTDIWSFINSNALKAFSNSDYYKFTQDLSTHLNTLWDPAWNVITVKTVDTSDTVLYGYAFREHWMWYNGFRLSGNVYSFVIWKDYNCQDWGTVGAIQKGATDFTTEEQTQIKNSINSSADKSDIWLIAKTFMNSLKSQTLFKGDSTAYSLVLSQDNTSTSYYGRICMVKNRHIYDY